MPCVCVGGGGWLDILCWLVAWPHEPPNLNTCRQFTQSQTNTVKYYIHINRGSVTSLHPHDPLGHTEKHRLTAVELRAVFGPRTAAAWTQSYKQACTSCGKVTLATKSDSLISWSVGLHSGGEGGTYCSWTGRYKQACTSCSITHLLPTIL